MGNGMTEFIQPKKKNGMPLYTIGVVSEVVGTTNQTLRIYEKHGLIKPSRKNKHRFYSENDIRWLLCLRELIHNKKISIEGIKKLLDFAPCWEIVQCSETIRNNCLAYRDNTKPCWELNQMICKDNSINNCKGCVVYKSKSAAEKELGRNEDGNGNGKGNGRGLKMANSPHSSRRIPNQEEPL
jgi:MerR family transcriptional regulator/heat shock protein HspR